MELPDFPLGKPYKFKLIYNKKLKNQFHIYKKIFKN